MLKRLAFALLWWNALGLGQAGEWWYSSEELTREASPTRHRKSTFDVLKGFRIPDGASGEAGSVERKVNKGLRTQCSRCSFQFDPKGAVYAMRCEHCVPDSPDAAHRLVKSDWFKAKQQPPEKQEQSRTTVMPSTLKAVTSSRPPATHKPTVTSSSSSSSSSSRPRATDKPDKPPLKSDSKPASLVSKGPTTGSRTVPSSGGSLSEDTTKQRQHSLPKDIANWPDALAALLINEIKMVNVRLKNKLSALLILRDHLKPFLLATGNALAREFVASKPHVTPVPMTSSTTTTTTVSTPVVPGVRRNRKRWHCRKCEKLGSVYPKKSRMKRPKLQQEHRQA